MLHTIVPLKLITSPITDYPFDSYSLSPLNLSKWEAECDFSRLSLGVTRLPNRRESKDSHAGGFFFLFVLSRSYLFCQPKTLLDTVVHPCLCSVTSARLVLTLALPLVTRSLLWEDFPDCKLQKF